jgi:predicted phosphodiesterase
MEKVIVLGDLHFGKSDEVDSELDKRLKEMFVYMENNGINTVIQLGDLVDPRKSLNTKTILNITKSYIEPINKAQLKLIQIIGNHDAYYNSTNDITSPRALLSMAIKDCDIYDTESSNWEGILSYCPWACEPEHGKFLFGHFEINGFEMTRGIECKNGKDATSFSNYIKVFSGHYHRRSNKGNIQYVGSLVDCDFGESDSKHGFCILDIDSGEYEFQDFKNPVHVKIVYDDKIHPIRTQEEIIGKIINLIKVKEEGYEEFKQSLLDLKPSKLNEKVLDVEVKSILNEENLDSLDSPLNLINEYIKQKDYKDIDGNNLFGIMEKVYSEAITSI